MDIELKKSEMKIIEKYAMNKNTFLMKLEAKDEIKNPGATYHVRIYNGSGESRPYTPIYVEGKHIAFVIKVYPGGKITQYLDAKKVGDSVCVSETLSSRKSRQNEFKNVLMIAGGTGVTPMYQMLKEQILTGNNETKFKLLFLNKTEEDVFLLKEISELQKISKGMLEIIHIFSQGIRNPDQTHISGKLNKELLLEIIGSECFDFIYICGPPTLYESFSGKKVSRTDQGEFSGILKEIGFKKEQVFKL